MSTIFLSSLEDTETFGKVLAESIDKSLLITLSGDLGAGKTTLVKAIGKSLGVEEVITSPTFTTMNEYDSGRMPLFHIDLYRVGESLDKRQGAFKAENKFSLDYFVLEFEEIIENRAIVIIEWPEFFIVDRKPYLKDFDKLALKLDRNQAEGDTARVLGLKASGSDADKVVNQILSYISKSSSIRIG